MKRSFGRVLDGIVSVVLASAAGSAGVYGCGGGTAGTTTTTLNEGGTSPIDAGGEGGFEDDGTFACNAPLPDPITNLKPAVPVDYVELRRQTFPNSSYQDPDAGADGGADAGPPPVVLNTASASGSACATAAYKNACLEKLAAAAVQNGTDGWSLDVNGGNAPAPPTFDKYFLVYTRGEEVGVVRSADELVTFFGAIDTLEEARLLLTSKGYTLSCQEEPRKSGWRQNTDGSWEVVIPGGGCASYIRIRFRVGVDGSVTKISSEDTAVACGRRPSGLVAQRTGGAESGLGPYFAEVAYLEAASVVAFRRLEMELARFGAPESLIRRARRARADEIRHARETLALARRFATEVPPLEIAPMTERDLLAIAIENATEGCVRETYGALVATFQARTAEDPEICRVLTRVARDEARHAKLSHDIAAWLDAQLDEPSRARVAAERAKALEELRAGIERAPASDVVNVAGVPTVREARALLAGLEQDVLAA
jgi:hypothetical protein